ncbi:3-carboxy-cis,cis-muconate cycloisomerase [Algihabitans albus]|uniref:3-carboxy-cis,cis-muconate cycloisomerase n=1 Tax=Algihabitans albus TaxID=2164067 RepID=UPI000E5D1F3B|nr:3-carboxy-cis,cis-muconate cycloisomerase [Algihabitans albus]
MHSRRVFPAYLDGLLGDPETETALSAESQIRAMLRVEAELAAVQAELRLIPFEAAEVIAGLCARHPIAPEALQEATARDGVVVPGLVAQLREALPPELAAYLHWGATSQDILDTAACLTLRTTLEIQSARLQAVMDRLAALADAHRTTVMPARTRGQQATPTTFGLKAAGWLMPLIRHAARLTALRRDALAVSLGGASGTQAAFGVQAEEIERRLALRLGLAVPVLPWHTQRERFVEIGSWMTGVAGALGKLAGDVLLLAQSEVGEVALAGSGGSSTMPNKANPTKAEAVVALARHTATEISMLHQAVLHDHERGGAAWQLEWLTLPSVAVSCGAALRQALGLLETLEVKAERMKANVEGAKGLLLAEAASFALAVHLPRPDAQALVEQACAEVRDSGLHLIDSLQRRCDLPIDWEALRDPLAQTGRSDALIDRVLAAHRDLRTSDPT